MSLLFKCHWSKASYVAVADFQKGREVHIYHVKKDLVDNPDCHTQSIRSEGGGGRGLEEEKKKKTRRFKNP